MEGNLYIYNVKHEVINIHPITDRLITYKDADYMDSLNQRLKSTDNEEIEKMAFKNLEILDQLRG